MRVLTGDAQRIEQMSWLLFLKIYDSREMVWELEEDDYESIRGVKMAKLGSCSKRGTGIDR